MKYCARLDYLPGLFRWNLKKIVSKGVVPCEPLGRNWRCSHCKGDEYDIHLVGDLTVMVYLCKNSIGQLEQRGLTMSTPL